MDFAFSYSPVWYYHSNSKLQCTARESFWRTFQLSTTDQTDKCANKNLQVSFLGNRVQKMFRFCFCWGHTFRLAICSKISLTCLIIRSDDCLTDPCSSPILSGICCHGERDKGLLQISKDNLASVISSFFRRQRGVLRESVPSETHDFC